MQTSHLAGLFACDLQTFRQAIVHEVMHEHLVIIRDILVREVFGVVCGDCYWEKAGVPSGVDSEVV